MSSRKRLLYIVHCYHNRAGVEEHIKVLSKRVAETYEVAIAYPEQNAVWLQRVVGKDESETSGEKGSFAAPGVGILAPFRAPDHERAMQQILQSFAPDLIHLVHFVNWPLSMLQQILSYGCPVVASFHDYYAITPHYTMQGESNPLDTTSAEYAQRIFAQDISDYLKKRREYLQKCFASFNALIVPSNYLKNTLQQVFNVNFDVIAYGIEAFTKVPPTEKWNNLRFGYLGSLLPQKGWQSMYQAFTKLRQLRDDVELRIYGGDLAEGVAAQGVSFHGVFTQEQIPRIVSEFDVGVVPSTFAETYSLVLSELWHGGKIAAVADIGALGERVSDGLNGKKFKSGDVDSIFEVLNWFCENEEWKKWQIPQPRLAEEMTEEYLAVYRNVIK